MKQTFTLSPSSLNLMQECPRCFWLSLHKKWKRPAGAFPSLPSGMDRVLKAHFDKFMKLGKLPPELCEEKTCQNLKLFDDEKLLEVWRNNKKGIVWSDKQGNALKGAVDNILMKGNKLVVLDYKTRGFPLKEDTAEHYQLQLDIYCYLLKMNGYKCEDYSFLLFYVPEKVLENGNVVFDTSLVKMGVDAGRGERVWRSALKLLNGSCPAVHQECPWCVDVEV